MFCIYQQRVDLIISCNQVSDVALGLLFCIYRKPTYLNYVFTGQVISFAIVKFCTYTQSPNYSNYSNYTNQHFIVYITTIHTVGLKTSSDQKMCSHSSIIFLNSAFEVALIDIIFVLVD